MARAPGSVFRSPRKAGALKLLEEWMRSYKPEELFDQNGTFRDEFADIAPKGQLAWG